MRLLWQHIRNTDVDVADGVRTMCPPERGEVAMSRRILVAEDDPMLQRLFRDYLADNSHGNATGPNPAVAVTDRPEEAKRWLQEGDGLLLLDGSVFKQMGMRLEELPGRVIICSADDDLVEEARRVGLRAVCKGSLSDLEPVLQELQKLA